MPIKKDSAGKRWVEMEVVVPGTPEQVWQAMATGAGNSAWFTKAAIDERVGGAVLFDFGPDMTSSGEVTVWEPPRRFGYVERNWMEGAPPVATEISITTRAGGQCLVRMVHSLYTSSDDWDDQMEGFEKGWPTFFEILRIYLGQYAGQRAHSFHATATVDADQRSIWKRLTEALGLTNANVGDARITPPEPESLSVVIDRVQQDDKQRLIIVRIDKPAPGVAFIGTYQMGPRRTASVGMFFYGDNAATVGPASEAAWRDWLARAFQPVAP